MAAYVGEKHDIGGVGIAALFLPIRTPEQIKAEAEARAKAIDAMVATCPYPGSDSTRIDCAALYDAGYAKFEIVDEQP
ncbi:hypothetical protein [Pseudomonas thivervalensis]|uniref:hypothetical protein n=1 Tax=Pseudomonas thivervalensis TaxID=86265 RepID=UPI00069D70C5|nr:hypothetical protein [Pseudomonas thivervalensis]